MKSMRAWEGYHCAPPPPLHRRLMSLPSSHHIIISLYVCLQSPCKPCVDNGLPSFRRQKPFHESAKNPFMSPLCKSPSAFLPGWFSQGWRRAARWQTSQRAFVPSRFHVKCNNAWGTKTEESDLRCVSARQARQQEHKSTERCERFNHPLLHRVTLAETEQISQPPSLWERWELGLDWTWVVFVLDELWRPGSFSKTAEQEIKCKYHAVGFYQSFVYAEALKFTLKPFCWWKGSRPLWGGQDRTLL